MNNYLLAMAQAATNPNVITIDTFWVGVWITFFFSCGLIYLGFKNKVLQVPKFISVKEAFQNFLEIINRNATNEGRMREFIDEASEIQILLTKYVQKNSDHATIFRLKKSMVESTGDQLFGELCTVIEEVNYLSDLMKSNIDLVKEQLNARNNYDERKKVPKTKKVEVDNGRGNWQYVDAQYAPKQQAQATPDFEVFPGFFTQGEIDQMARHGVECAPVYLNAATTFQVEYKNGRKEKLTGKQIWEMQTRAENRFNYRVDFIINNKI